MLVVQFKRLCGVISTYLHHDELEMIACYPIPFRIKAVKTRIRILVTLHSKYSRRYPRFPSSFLAIKWASKIRVPQMELKSIHAILSHVPFISVYSITHVFLFQNLHIKSNDICFSSPKWRDFSSLIPPCYFNQAFT